MSNAIMLLRLATLKFRVRSARLLFESLRATVLVLWLCRNNLLSRNLDMASRTAWELSEYMAQHLYFFALRCHHGGQLA